MWPASVSGPALSFTRAMAGVAFEHVAKVYPDGTRAVDDMTLEIRDGEFVVIVGPSGSGKTTALRMVAGLEEISEGTIAIGDRVVNHFPPRTATSRWSSRATRSIRTSRCSRTSRSGSR